MTSAFSTNDTECLSREIEQNYDVKEFKQIWSESRLDECSRWIQKNNFTKVCLEQNKTKNFIQTNNVLFLF